MLHRTAARAATVVGALALVVVPTTLAAAAPVAPATGVLATASEPSGPCPDADGVTVVVDLTDLGGEVEVGCAPGTPESGTAALLAAGFTEERAESGLICAIAGQPDPCPAEFDGSFWSYWNAEPGGEWVSYQVGSDDATPAAGSVEGWRYNDGSTGPSIDPPAPGAAGDDAEPTATETAAAEPGDGPTSTTVDERTGAATDPAIAPLAVAAAAVALLALVAVLATRRRRDPNGPAGQS